MSEATLLDGQSGTAEIRCSQLATGESLAGTAPQAQGWLLLTSQHSWPNRAVESLVPESIRSWAKARNLAILLIRQRPNHSDDDFTYWISDDEGTLLMGTRHSFADVPDISLAKPADPMLIICTNGKRDQCCAIEGRHLLKAIQSMTNTPLQRNIWEGTHIGGHRFAPTALYLPGNLVVGRLTPEVAVQLLNSGEISASFIRGRSHLTPCEQVLEAHIDIFEEIIWEDATDQCDQARHIHSGTHNGVSMQFSLTSTPLPIRNESCGGKPIPGTTRTWEGKSDAN